MADSVLRVRAIADMSQAKSEIKSLNQAELKGAQEVAAARALDAKRQADLLKIQVEQARIAGKSKDEIKGMSQGLKMVQAEARIATTEASFLKRELGEANRASRAAGSGGGSGPGEGVTKMAKGNKILLQKLGVPESALEGGVLNAGALKAGLAAAITAAILAGFKSIAVDSRAARASIAGSANGLADVQNEFQEKAEKMGVSRDEIARVLGKATGQRGVATSAELTKAALDQLESGGIPAAEKAIRETAAGREAITSEQIASRAARTRARDFEIQSSLANADAIESTASEEEAKRMRQDRSARGGVTVAGWSAAKIAAFLGLGEESQMNAESVGNTATLLGRNLVNEGSRFNVQRVEVINPTARPLNGD